MLWIAVLGLLLLPTAAGRVLLDVAGGLVLVLLALPLILGGVGWLGWKVLQSRMTTCGVCGTVNFSHPDHVRCAVMTCLSRLEQRARVNRVPTHPRSMTQFPPALPQSTSALKSSTEF